ncbi:MAG: aspartyl protease family protein [Bacteroidota bacterium]
MRILLKCIYAAIIFFGTSKLAAQEQFIDPPSKQLTSFPFQLLSGGVIIVKAKLNNYPDSLHFILDTGSGGISLDSMTVEKYKIPVVPSEKKIKGIGGIKKVSFLNDATLYFPGLTVEHLNFHVNDYEILTNVYGIKIDGIIGYSFFVRYIVHINYDNTIITVNTTGEYKYPRGGYMLNPLFTAIPIQQTSFKDSREMMNRFYFDTGAGLNFLISESFARDSAVLHRKRKPPVITQAEGLGGKMVMRYTTVKWVKVGPYKFRKVPTHVFEDPYNVTNYPLLGGLLGNDLLRRFNTTFNYVKQELHIVPNSQFKDFFDYAYTGLAMYYVDGEILIDEVAPGSPADKAGFKKNDYVLAINNDFSKSIQSYRVKLQSVREKLTFLILRDGDIITLNLKPVSIL